MTSIASAAVCWPASLCTALWELTQPCAALHRLHCACPSQSPCSCCAVSTSMDLLCVVLSYLLSSALCRVALHRPALRCAMCAASPGAAPCCAALCSTESALPCAVSPASLCAVLFALRRPALRHPASPSTALCLLHHPTMCRDGLRGRCVNLDGPECAALCYVWCIALHYVVLSCALLPVIAPCCAASPCASRCHPASPYNAMCLRHHHAMRCAVHLFTVMRCVPL